MRGLIAARVLAAAPAQGLRAAARRRRQALRSAYER
jgi:hypothetical protein